MAKKSSRSMLLVLFIIIAIPALIFGVGKVDPLKLAVMQEVVLSTVHGGLGKPYKTESVDGCVMVPVNQGEQEYRAVRYVTRTTRFPDGAVLDVTYSMPPGDTVTNCP